MVEEVEDPNGDSASLPTEDEILHALDSTGFLLEQRVANAFMHRDGFDVDINSAYEDDESGKTREIDVFAQYDRHAGDKRAGAPLVVANFIVECKNSPDPFLVMGRNRSREAFYLGSYSTEFDPFDLGFDKVHGAPIYFGLPRLEKDSSQRGFMGCQLVRMGRRNKKWTADNAGIYDSILYPRWRRPRSITSLNITPGGPPTICISQSS
jgi:hypothetical protein